MYANTAKKKAWATLVTADEITPDTSFVMPMTRNIGLLLPLPAVIFLAPT
jgi:hypothetical protein